MSGPTQGKLGAAVMEKDSRLSWPADISEGSDQHRDGSEFIDRPGRDDARAVRDSADARLCC